MPDANGDGTGEVGPHRYLDGLPAEQRALLERVNSVGLQVLRGYLASAQAVAFLGAGASAPLYPLWQDTIHELINAAERAGLSEKAAATCRNLAATRPQAVVELLVGELGRSGYQQILHETFLTRRDPQTGRTWTDTHELVARCAFKAVVTTNYDPGILHARMKVRLRASDTGFATWADEDSMDRWLTGEIFAGEELPVLFAHGHHNRPEDVVLARTEYGRAYAGRLAAVLRNLIVKDHLVWIGSSFSDQSITGIVREVAIQEIASAADTLTDPGDPVRHVALMPWDPTRTAGNGALYDDPEALAELAKIEYRSQSVFYPTRDGDHSALQVLLEELADPRFPPVPGSPATVEERASRLVPVPVVRWVHGRVPAPHFTGRAEELAWLDRWASDPQVRLIGATAWGGTGKTALVTEWLTRPGGPPVQGVRGLFAWSFCEDRSAEAWAQALLDWAERELDLKVPPGPPAKRVLDLASKAPLLLVLDGLEVHQEDHSAGTTFGQLRDGTLREILTGWCFHDHHSLAVLTSRVTFADLEHYDGGTARMFDVPALTPDEGAAILAASGVNWVSDADLRDLVAAVDGHALAVTVLAAILATKTRTPDIDTLREELIREGRTDARVGKVLGYYADRLTEADRTGRVDTLREIPHNGSGWTYPAVAPTRSRPPISA